ncbi:MAG: SpoVG family protein [Phycisphaerales bacterium]|nr:MAG: SpoVG family protein [Phycisphaerales bacterium]
MEITDIRMRLVNSRTDRLKAFCTVTFDDEFVIRDIKIVEGTNGFFIAMPSRKATSPCPSCGHKNQVRARFCEECGAKLRVKPMPDDPAERVKLHRDIAHPITPAFREKLQTRIVEVYRMECEREPVDEDYRDDMHDDAHSDSHAQGGEYDDLIAGLNGGSRESSRQGGDDSSRRRGGEGRSRERKGGSSDDNRRRRRGRDRRPRDEERGRRSEPRTVRDDDDKPRDDDRVEEPADELTSDQAGREEPAATASAEPERGGRDHVSLDKAAADASGSDDALEDTSTPFGMGII